MRSVFTGCPPVATICSKLNLPVAVLGGVIGCLSPWLTADLHMASVDLIISETKNRLLERSRRA